ncbi:hypothetical protein GCM10011611_29990 [Aliidongia dinghuensis]|uniref:Uncharacterized protein n=1 Tax=Aliidongia dinghuensis TaxID=1867774 RepID=A0A8J3E482_9PROT|nr:hypothetical protein [Aliidongia dinghuensis]GGF21934.1 hypothetical protein GCM10011611_29990 [Aliidongia dinghuensis]
MPNVGFFGGHTVHELGPAADMQAFFACVNIAASRLHLDPASLSLIDRLYRRYVRLEELQATALVIERIRAVMAAIPPQNVDWNSITPPYGATKLDISKPNLADLFSRYFLALDDATKSAESFYKKFGKYRPVLTIISDMPRFVIDEKRPMSDYDTLQGEPIWLR